VPKPKAKPRDILSLASIAKLNDHRLITHLKKHFGPAKRHWHRELPYLQEAHRRFSQPGRRMPLPGKPFWSVFCKHELGVSVRTVQRWLAEKEGRTPKKHQGDKYTAADLAHLEQVAHAAQKLAEDDPDEEAFEPIRRAIREKPSGLFVRKGRVQVEHNKYYEGNKKDGKHYWLTPASYLADVQKRYPGIVDVLPYPRPEGYDALTAPWPKKAYANVPFGTTIDPITGKKIGLTAFARKTIAEQAKGNTTVIPYPMDFGFHLLVNAGAKFRSVGRIPWVATEDGSSQPSGRLIMEIEVTGKEVV
jgi:hypothetical protein